MFVVIKTEGGPGPDYWERICGIFAHRHEAVEAIKEDACENRLFLMLWLENDTWVSEGIWEHSDDQMNTRIS